MIEKTGVEIGHDCFLHISKLFAAREHWPFISRAALHHEIVSTVPPDELDSSPLTFLEMGDGIDLMLNAFAISGPNESLWQCVCEDPDYYRDLTKRFRYKVERDGHIGYVDAANLTAEELDAKERVS